MKILKSIISLVLTVGILCCFAAGCSRASIGVPTNFSINDDYKLSWSPIKDARSYVVKVTSDDGEEKEYPSRRAYYSMSKLEEGDYKVIVKAVSGNKDFDDSEWSEAFDFKKDYESGCIYTLTNNKTEYEVSRVGTAGGVVDLGDTYRGKPITSIAEGAFKGSTKLEKLKIGKYVKTIGAKAFFNCTKLSEIDIPETVTSIGESAFHACRSLQSIKLPSGIKEIPDYMFISCRSLIDVALPEVESIGVGAFSNTSIFSLSIPDSVKSIASNAFSGCASLTEIKMGDGVEEIGESAFNNCKILETVTFGESGNLKKIGANSFSFCNSLKNVSVPEGVEDIATKAFYDCNSLESVDLPDSLTHVGEMTFNGTALYVEATKNSQFVYADNWLVFWTGAENAEVKEKFTNLNKTTLENENIEGIADNVFANSNLLSIDLPDSVRVIGKTAFAGSSKLGRLYTYENSMTEESNLRLIDEQAFRGCKLLNRVFLNKGLEEIARYAFYNCTNLVNNAVVGYSIIPDSVESIGVGAFEKTSLYESAKDIVYAGSWIVGYKDTTASSITVTGMEEIKVRGIADYAFYKHEELKSVALSTANANSLRYIGRGAFYGCSGLSAVSFSRVLERIEDYTFYKCSSLFKLSFTPRLKSIGKSAFYKCESLDEVDLSGTQVSEIGPYAFYMCKNIKKLDLGSNLQKVEDNTFYKCVSVTDLVIPDSVSEIGDRAFYKCLNLRNIDFGGNVGTIGEHAFNGCAMLNSLNIPDSVKNIGNYAFYKCIGITELNLGEGVKQIGNYAFGNLSSLTELDLPDSVTSIGKYAFMNCGALVSVTLKAENLSVGLHSFYGCNLMTAYLDAETLPLSWNSRWNSSFRPVFFGCELSEDGKYVVCVTLTENTLLNMGAKNGISSPIRDGYEFLGWSKQSGADQAEYESAQLKDLEAGTTVYAVWKLKSEESKD